MKKIIAISACLLMLMSFAACGGGEYVEYVPEETNEDGEIIIDGENDEWDVFNEEESTEEDAEETTAPTKKLPSTNPDELVMTDYIGVSMKEIIRAFGDDYVIKDGFEGTNYFICYEESVCPFDIGICYFSDNFENIDGMDIVNCVWSTIDDGTMSINGDITTDITYKEVKELTGSELSWNGDDDSYVSVYEDENGYIIRFYWESEKPADNEKAFSVLVYAKAG